MAGCVLSKNKTRPRNFLKIAKNDPGCSLMLFNPRPSLRTLRTLRLPGRALIPPILRCIWITNREVVFVYDALCLTDQIYSPLTTSSEHKKHKKCANRLQIRAPLLPTLDLQYYFKWVFREWFCKKRYPENHGNAINGFQTRYFTTKRDILGFICLERKPKLKIEKSLDDKYLFQRKQLYDLYIGQGP